MIDKALREFDALMRSLAGDMHRLGDAPGGIPTVGPTHRWSQIEEWSPGSARWPSVQILGGRGREPIASSNEIGSDGEGQNREEKCG